MLASSAAGRSKADSGSHAARGFQFSPTRHARQELAPLVAWVLQSNERDIVHRQRTGEMIPGMDNNFRGLQRALVGGEIDRSLGYKDALRGDRVEARVAVICFGRTVTGGQNPISPDDRATAHNTAGSLGGLDGNKDGARKCPGGGDTAPHDARSRR